MPGSRTETLHHIFWLLTPQSYGHAINLHISLLHLNWHNSCCMKFSFCRKITVPSCWHCGALIVLDKSPPFPTETPSSVRIITPGANYPSPPLSFHKPPSPLPAWLEYSHSSPLLVTFPNSLWIGRDIEGSGVSRRQTFLKSTIQPLNTWFNMQLNGEKIHHIHPLLHLLEHLCYITIKRFINISARWKRPWLLLMKVLCQCVWHIVIWREVILQIPQMAPFILQLISLCLTLWSWTFIGVALQ